MLLLIECLSFAKRVDRYEAATGTAVFQIKPFYEMKDGCAKSFGLNILSHSKFPNLQCRIGRASFCIYDATR